jgi:hypothetical protein
VKETPHPALLLTEVSQLVSRVLLWGIKINKKVQGTGVYKEKGLYPDCRRVASEGIWHPEVVCKVA